ncbi:hypothetical protein V8C86DRAFT_2644116 [Haematococcus lacustris]
MTKRASPSGEEEEGRKGRGGGNPTGAMPNMEEVEPPYQAEYANTVNKLQDIAKKSREYGQYRQSFEGKRSLLERLNAAIKMAGIENQAAAEQCATTEEKGLAAEREAACAVAALDAAKEAAKKAETAKLAVEDEKKATQERKRKAEDDLNLLQLQRDRSNSALGKVASQWKAAHKEVDLPEDVIQAALEWERRQAQGPAAEAGKAPAAPMPPGTAPAPSAEAMTSAEAAGRAQGAAVEAAGVLLGLLRAGNVVRRSAAESV